MQPTIRPVYASAPKREREAVSLQPNYVVAAENKIAEAVTPRVNSWLSNAEVVSLIINHSALSTMEKNYLLTGLALSKLTVASQTGSSVSNITRDLWAYNSGRKTPSKIMVDFCEENNCTQLLPTAPVTAALQGMEDAYNTTQRAEGQPF